MMPFAVAAPVLSVARARLLPVYQNSLVAMLLQSPQTIQILFQGVLFRRSVFDLPLHRLHLCDYCVKEKHILKAGFCDVPSLMDVCELALPMVALLC